MKRIYKYSAICMIFYLFGCQPPEVGYLSDHIHALEDTIYVPRGIFSRSAAPEPENSTYPLHWEITEIRDANGEITNELLEEHEILTWIEAFDGRTDTTLELAQKKLQITKEPSLLINDVSGEFAFTQATRQVDSDIFHIDVAVTNVRGTKEFEDFVVVKLDKFKPVEFVSPSLNRLLFIQQDGKTKTGYQSEIRDDFDDNVPSVLDGSHPHINVVKLDKNPEQSLRVKFTVTDAFDNPVNPKNVRLSFQNNGQPFASFHENSLMTTTDDESTYFTFLAPPFPQYSSTASNENQQYFMFYETTPNVFEVDTVAYEKDFGKQDWSTYRHVETNEIMNMGWMRWAIKLNDFGTWEVKMRIPYTKLKTN